MFAIHPHSDRKAAQRHLVGIIEIFLKLDGFYLEVVHFCYVFRQKFFELFTFFFFILQVIVTLRNKCEIKGTLGPS